MSDQSNLAEPEAPLQHKDITEDSFSWLRDRPREPEFVPPPDWNQSKENARQKRLHAKKTIRAIKDGVRKFVRGALPETPRDNRP